MPPEQRAEARIREYLEREGPTEVSRSALLVTWRERDGKEPDISSVARMLRHAGIVVEPALEEADADTQLRLSLAEPGVGRRRAQPEPPPEPEPRRARPRPEPEPEPEAPEPPLADPGEGLRLMLGGGAVVTVAALFLPWFGAFQGGVQVPMLSTGWQWYGVLDVYLVLVAIGAGALAVVPSEQRRLLSLVVAGAAAIALFCVAYQVANPPSGPSAVISEVSRRIGPYVALLGLAIAGAGAWLAGARDLLEGRAAGRGEEAVAP